jgi:hypothetical protein
MRNWTWHKNRVVSAQSVFTFLLYFQLLKREKCEHSLMNVAEFLYYGRNLCTFRGTVSAIPGNRFWDWVQQSLQTREHCKKNDVNPPARCIVSWNRVLSRALPKINKTKFHSDVGLNRTVFKSTQQPLQSGEFCMLEGSGLYKTHVLGVIQSSGWTAARAVLICAQINQI